MAYPSPFFGDPAQSYDSWSLGTSNIVAPSVQLGEGDVRDRHDLAGQSKNPDYFTAAQFAKFLTSEIVTIFVGPDREEFKLSKELLCHVSPFFKAAFEGDFKEGQEQTMELLDDDVEAFGYVVTYLYRANFGSAPLGDWDFKLKLPTLIYVLELAERFQVPDVKEAATDNLIDAIYNNGTPIVNINDVQLAFNLLPANSRGLKTIVDAVTNDLLTDDSQQSAGGFAGWRFEPAFESIEGFDAALIFSLKRLAINNIGRPRCDHDWRGPNELRCQGSTWLRPAGYHS